MILAPLYLKSLLLLPLLTSSCCCFPALPTPSPLSPHQTYLSLCGDFRFICITVSFIFLFFLFYFYFYFLCLAFGFAVVVVIFVCLFVVAGGFSYFFPFFSLCLTFFLRRRPDISVMVNLALKKKKKQAKNQQASVLTCPVFLAISFPPIQSGLVAFFLFFLFVCFVYLFSSLLFCCCCICLFCSLFLFSVPLDMILP